LVPHGGHGSHAPPPGHLPQPRREPGHDPFQDRPILVEPVLHLDREDALTVLRASATATEADLVVHCRGRLARVKVPRAVDLVASLPKGGTGKILKRKVRERYWSG
jgi:acyl-CoA synthetase (AMP-forming)/AMP-acid ligase II